jgi:hypothetical protein
MACSLPPQGFESAAFKLSHEMTQLLDPGNTRTSAVWARFEELCIRGYLAVREGGRDVGLGSIMQSATM